MRTRFLHVNAGNKASEHQRLFLLIEEGCIAGIWKEDFKGSHCVPEPYWPMADKVINKAIRISPEFYRRLYNRLAN